MHTFSCTLIYGFCFLLFSALCPSTNHVRRLPLANFLFVASSMLVSQTSPLGVELFSYANAFFFPKKSFVQLLFKLCWAHSVARSFTMILFSIVLSTLICASTNHVHRPPRAIYLLLMVTVWQTSIGRKFYFEAIRAVNQVLQNLLASSSLRKHPFLLALRRLGRARRNGCFRRLGFLPLTDLTR